MDKMVSGLLRNPLVLTIARVLIAGPFVMAGAFKAMDLGSTAGYIANGSAAFTLPFATLLAILVIIVEIGGGFLVILNRQFAAVAALVLAAFCLFTGVFYHLMPADIASLGDQMNQNVAMKNFAWAGGLIGMAALAKR